MPTPSLTFLVFLLRNGDLLTVEQHVELLGSETLLEFYAFGLLYYMADELDKTLIARVGTPGLIPPLSATMCCIDDWFRSNSWATCWRKSPFCQ